MRPKSEAEGNAKIKVQRAKLRKSSAFGGLRNFDVWFLIFDFCLVASGF